MRTAAAMQWRAFIAQWRASARRRRGAQEKFRPNSQKPCDEKRACRRSRTEFPNARGRGYHHLCAKQSLTAAAVKCIISLIGIPGTQGILNAWAFKSSKPVPQTALCPSRGWLQSDGLPQLRKITTSARQDFASVACAPLQLSGVRYPSPIQSSVEYGAPFARRSQ